MTNYQYVLYEKKDHIAYVTINRPEVMNALHAAANQELTAVFRDFVADEAAWVAILSGAGERAFCAGNDLKATAEATARGEAPFATRQTEDGQPVYFGGLIGLPCPKPIIAAVNGVAAGGGFELALACDLIIAAEHARFALPEPRVGLIAAAGGMHRLPQQLPLKIAMGLLLTGKWLSAQEAAHYGLVNEVVPLERLHETAERWANEILECSPLSVRLTKEAVLAGLGRPVEEALIADQERLRILLASEDFREGPRAFVEKRKPQWKGR
ncbi:enoyl-CoA hydratase-related protein [Thermogemmatispora sp.]|uniref:enoyl-CoA hydratase-related protein n=1 Tax=Thermogemmatispora sp. TaxID=1968838 RepID=UPI00260FEF13|nr:enoyl-CoA hydratase-related protein [Thermogemmatispora sp.]